MVTSTNPSHPSSSHVKEPTRHFLVARMTRKKNSAHDLLKKALIKPKALSREQTKKQFAKFEEDYNTVIASSNPPTRKITFYEQMTALRTDEALPPTSSTYDPDADLRAHSAHKQTRHHQRPNESGGESFMNEEQLQELRKVQPERFQVGQTKLMGMNIG